MITKLPNISFQGTFINKTTPQDREEVKKMVGDKGISNVDKAIATFKKGVEKYYPAGDTVELRIGKDIEYADELNISTSHKEESGKVYTADVMAEPEYVAKDDYFYTEDYGIGYVDNGKQYLESILLEGIPHVNSQTMWKLQNLRLASARKDDMEEKRLVKPEIETPPATNDKTSLMDKLKKLIHKK